MLLDIWAKLAQPDAVYYDITWTGSVGAPSENSARFSTSCAARVTPASTL